MKWAKRNSRIAEEYQAGYTLMFLSDKFGLTLERIRQILAEQGIERRPASLHYPQERTAYLCLDCGVEIGRRQKRCPDCAKSAKYRQTQQSAKRAGKSVRVPPPATVAHPGTHITPVPPAVLRQFQEWRAKTRAQGILNAGTVTQERVMAVMEEEEFPIGRRWSRGYAICCPDCNRKLTEGIHCRCGAKGGMG